MRKRRCGMIPPPWASAPAVSPCSATACRRHRRKARKYFRGGTEPAVRHGAGGRHIATSGSTDGVMAFPYTAGADRHFGDRAETHQLQARRTLDGARSLLPSPGGRKLYLPGRLSHQYRRRGDGRGGRGRAAIYELSDLADGSSRIFASGLRNAVGMAWEPRTGVLWTVVNERDGLGDETPPDYLTSVRGRGSPRLALLLHRGRR